MGIDLGKESFGEHKKLVLKPKENKTIGLEYDAPSSAGTFDCVATIRYDDGFVMIPLKVQVFEDGVNFFKDFLDFGVIYKRWVAIFFEFSRFYEKFQGFAPDPFESLQ